jgi:hypothetical protein
MAAKTLDEYIEQTNRDFFNLRKTSVLLTVDGFETIQRNVLEDYLPIITSRAVTVTLTAADMKKYWYKPRLLSKVIYNTENLYYLILQLNNLTVETFTPTQLILLDQSSREIIENIINKEINQGTITG